MTRNNVGRDVVCPRLVAATAVHPWQAHGIPVIDQGHIRYRAYDLPLVNLASISARADALPTDLRLRLRTLLRLKSEGRMVHRFDLAVLLAALQRRFDMLAAAWGTGRWPWEREAILSAARSVVVEHETSWQSWNYASRRPQTPTGADFGGLEGVVSLRGVPPSLRALLVMGTLIHAGKACVFGHGAYDIEPY